MYHKHPVDDRIHSALKQAQASHEVARAMRAGSRRSGPVARLLKWILSRNILETYTREVRLFQTSLQKSK